MPTNVVTRTQAPTSPKYTRLAAELRRQIEAGSLKSGDRLPSFPEMKARHGISQATLERAHALLEREGLIVRQQGRGTFVAPPRREGEAAGGNGGGARSLMQDALVVLTNITGEPPAGQEGETGFTADITYGVIRAIRETSLHAIALHPQHFLGPEIARLVAERPRGVVIAEMIHQTAQACEWADALLSAGGIPVVLSGGSPEFTGYDRVMSDHESGSYQLTRWLVQQSRRRILPVWPAPATGYWFAQRLAGYERALREAELNPLAPVVWPAAASESPDREEFGGNVRRLAGYLAEHFVGPDCVDALLVASDRDVFYAAAACRLYGKEPNRDVAIVGYDNYWAHCHERAFEPAIPLATMDKRNAQMGREMVGLLLRRVEGGLPQGPHFKVVPPKMIVLDPHALRHG